MDKNRLGDACCWMIKLPYLTNQIYIKVKDDLNIVLSRLKGISKHYYGALPYAIMQRQLINKKEIKVVCVNEEPKYIAKILRGGGSKECKKIDLAETNFMEFAKLAIDTAKKIVQIYFVMVYLELISCIAKYKSAYM